MIRLNIQKLTSGCPTNTHFLQVILMEHYFQRVHTLSDSKEVLTTPPIVELSGYAPRLNEASFSVIFLSKLSQVF